MSTKKIKIATISTSSKGGGGIAAFRLHQSLNNSTEVSSSFINAHTESDKASTLIKLLPKKSILRLIQNQEKEYLKKINSLPLKCEIATIPFSAFKVEDCELVSNADIVHLHWVAEFLNYPSFLKKIKQPIVWTLHDMNPFQGIFHYKNDELNNKNAASINREILNQKKQFIQQHQNIHVVCLTDWMLQASKRSKILGKYPHHLIPNGLDFTKFGTEHSKEELKLKFNLNSNKTLLFISQDVKNYRKGYDLLIEALRLVNDYSFNVITVGNNEIEIPTNFNHLHFNHMASLSDLNEFYSVADLYTLPSREDNLPNVILESFANGTPVLVFNTGGMKDWIISGKNGILAEELSDQSFAKELINFANNEYVFNSSVIKQYAIKHFNQNDQTKKYIDLYQSIISK